MSRLDLLQIECERGNFHHVNDTSESKEMSMQFCADMKDALIELSTLTAKVKRYEEALKSIAALHLTEKWQLDDIKKNSEVTYTDTMIARAALNQGEESK